MSGCCDRREPGCGRNLAHVRLHKKGDSGEAHPSRPARIRCESTTRQLSDRRIIDGVRAGHPGSRRCQRRIATLERHRGAGQRPQGYPRSHPNLGRAGQARRRRCRPVLRHARARVSVVRAARSRGVQHRRVRRGVQRAHRAPAPGLLRRHLRRAPRSEVCHQPGQRESGAAAHLAQRHGQRAGAQRRGGAEAAPLGAAPRDVGAKQLVAVLLVD